MTSPSQGRSFGKSMPLRKCVINHHLNFVSPRLRVRPLGVNLP